MPEARDWPTGSDTPLIRQTCAFNAGIHIVHWKRIRISRQELRPCAEFINDSREGHKTSERHNEWPETQRELSSHQRLDFMMQPCESRIYIYAMSMPHHPKVWDLTAAGWRAVATPTSYGVPLPLIQSHSQPEETEFMTETSSSSCSFRTPSLCRVPYEVGLGFICAKSAFCLHSGQVYPLTFLLPPVRVTLTKRRV